VKIRHSRTTFNLLITFGLLAIVASAPAKAGCLIEKFSRLIYGEHHEVTAIDSTQPIQLRLEKAYRKWLEKNSAIPKYQRQNLAKQYPDYTVLTQLGEGAEGTVYLVRDARGNKYVLKVFHKRIRQEDVDANIRAMSNQIIPTVKVEKIMNDHRAMVLEYVEGISVNELTLFPEKFGLTRNEANKIKEEFVRFKKSYQGNNTPPDYNVVYKFKTGRFVLIDPW